MKIQEKISQMIDILPNINFDDYKKATCPKIVLNGWWWKKHFAHYRNLSETYNALYLHEWMNGGYEIYEEMYKIMMDRELLASFGNAWETKYTNDI